LELKILQEQLRSGGEIKMIQKRIPENYDFDHYELITTLKTNIPNTRIDLKGRFLTIHKELTAQQKQDLKNLVLPLLTSVEDITI